MSADIPTEQSEYTLLSESWKEVIAHVEQQEPGAIISRWFRSAGSMLHFMQYPDYPLYDEERLIQETRIMLAKVDKDGFFALHFLPESVGKLKEAYEATQNEDHENEYLAYALIQQRQRLIDYLWENSGDEISEKRLGNLSRGIERKLLRVQQIEDEIANPDVIATKRRRLGRNKRRNKAPEQDLIFSLLEEVLSTVSDSVSIALNTLNKITKLEDEIYNQSQRYERISIQLEINALVNELLADTEDRLRKLGIDETGWTVKSSGQQAENETTTIQKPQAQQKPNGAKGPKKRHGKTSKPRAPRSKEQSTPAPLTDLDQSMERSLTSLGEAIACAATHGNNLRLLLPENPRVRSAFLESWKEVLDHLGYNGEITVVDQKNLRKTHDYGTPIIVPDKMNTHRNIWKPREFHNVFNVAVSSPKVILNQLTTS